MWTEQEARDKLAELIERAEAGEPQYVGDKGVVISRAEYERLKTIEAEDAHPGRWLVRHLAGLGPIELPSRDEGRPSPFAEWEQEGKAE